MGSRGLETTEAVDVKYFAEGATDLIVGERPARRADKAARESAGIASDYRYRAELTVEDAMASGRKAWHKNCRLYFFLA